MVIQVFYECLNDNLNDLKVERDWIALFWNESNIDSNDNSTWEDDETKSRWHNDDDAYKLFIITRFLLHHD